jgi:CHASE2 domain-containing sensor protein
MTKLVVLKLDGDLTTGFKVNVEIFLSDKSFDGRKSGQLPAAIELLRCLESWQLEYRSLGTNQRIKGKKVIFTSGNARSRLNLWGEQLQERFQDWLKAASFQEVNLWLREKLSTTESIRVLLCTDEQKVHQLPWSQWDFVQRYPHTEITLSRLDVVEVAPSFSLKRQVRVRILAIFGSSHNIDVKEDLKILSTCPNTYLKPLVRPQREELYSCLWSECWDLVFFAGHSETIADAGIIYLNDRDILTIADLEYALQKAIANGLRLAIFNSCDGLGLAYALGKLGLPQIVVMREPIADWVAHQFLRYFLTEYSSNQPLHLATRKARERLQGLEEKYPFSSWLPILYQNQSATPLSWLQLMGVDEKPVIRRPKYDYPQLVLVIAISLLAWWGQTLGWLQAGELHHYDRALSFRPIEARDERILVITVDDGDLDYQYAEGVTRQGSLTDEALGNLLTKLQPYQPIAIASDIIHDFPYSAGLQPIITRQANFIAICRVKNENSQLESIAAPPEIPLEQTGFTNIAIDNDGVIRRHILGMSPDLEKCQTDLSLSLRMALKYLDYVAIQTAKQTTYPRRFLANGNLEIGQTIFPKIEFNSGGYQLPKTENQGYQIMLNYRNRQPQMIALQEILEEKSTQKIANLVKEKIIFIGVKSHNNDLHYTPDSYGQQAARIPGVLIHAQATSQIISAVLDRRKTIKWFSPQIEFFWTLTWSIFGTGVILISNLLVRKKQNLFLTISIAIAVALTVLYLSYLTLLFSGYWLPLITPIWALMLSAIGSFLVIEKQKKSQKVLAKHQFKV